MTINPSIYNQCLKNGIRECNFQWMQSKLIIPQVKLSNNEMNKQINDTVINNNESRYLSNVQMI